MKKKVGYALLLIVLVAGAVGYYMWNKPHRSIEDARTQQISAIELSNAFVADEAKANAQYLNKALTVTGTVAGLEVNASGQQVVFMNGADPLSGVQCTFPQKDETLQVGANIAVSGFCNGFTMVVILDDCKILK